MAMIHASLFITIVTISLLLVLHLPSSLQQQNCSTVFSFNDSVVYNLTKCASLSTQGAVLAWTYYEANSSLDIAFAGQAPSAGGWVGWGLNPSAPVMVGSSVLIAFSAANGSNLLPFKLTETVQQGDTPLVCSPVDLDIKATAVEIRGSSMSLFASLRLSSNRTVLNHVWNRGPGVSSFRPQPHSLDPVSLSGFATLNMSTAQIVPGSTDPPHSALKRAHGIINTISWGILFPIGVFVARYLRRPFASMDPAWFYIHVTCQSLGYSLGLVGWAIGMRLRTLSGAVHRSHFNIGIALFVMASVQVVVGSVRPDKGSKFRKYWNVIHQSVGYTIVLFSIVNIFQGLNILQSLNILKPGNSWRPGYIASVSVMGVLAVSLETVTWVRYFKQRK